MSPFREDKHPNNGKTLAPDRVSLANIPLMKRDTDPIDSSIEEPLKPVENCFELDAKHGQTVKTTHDAQRKDTIT